MDRGEKEIDDTIKNSLLNESQKILDAVQDALKQIQDLSNSMYLECDGETPQLRVVTLVAIDCGTPQSRVHDQGIMFDGGTPINRKIAS